MSTVISVENISKQYRLGVVGTGTISHDLNRWWASIRGKEDPILKLGEINDRSKAGDSDYVWALRGINFEVKAGEVLGIIGRNGAGKSTLLKILSKTTQPTTGCVKIKGKVASLLEVGTGFHPELSGRDNIFLNGAILGMTKKEIQSKFDEIVDFSGVERYIDTPVKRYSSGMYVRLAFAVAAHLEPEILIVDEVLAVGDAEFQKKCLGKMKDVSVNEGRTVIFVSHNMSTISGLCERGLLLENGKVKVLDSINSVIQQYFFLGLDQDRRPEINKYRNSNNKETSVLIKDIFIKGQDKTMPVLSMGEPICIIVKLNILKPIKNANICFGFSNAEGIHTDMAFSWDDNFYLNTEIVGDYELTITINKLPLTPNKYTIGIGINQSFNTVAWDIINHYPIFEIENKLAVTHWDFRSWATHHLDNCIWDLKKT